MSAESALQKSLAESGTAQKQFQQDLKDSPIGRKFMKILGNDLVVATYARPDFRVIVKDPRTTLEDVLRPEYWTNVGAKLAATIKDHPFAVIEMIWDDSSKYVRLLVLDASQVWAKVKLLEFVDLTKVEAEEPPAATPDFIVKYVSPSVRWAIVRVSDGERVKAGIGSKEEAEKELSDLIKALKL